MATPLSTILSWFQTNDFPTQAQFEASWSSFFHMNDPIPMDKIFNLTTTLQNKVDKIVYEAHLSNADAHAGYLAKIDASNLSPQDVEDWKDILEVGTLPSNIGTVDEGIIQGNVYTKEQAIGLFMEQSEFLNNEGKFLASKIEALGLTRIKKFPEHTIQEFAANSAAYEFEESDIIALPSTDSEPTYSLYFYTEGDKTDEENYLNTGVSNITIAMIDGLNDELSRKIDKPLLDGNFYIKRQSGVTTTELLTDETLKSVVNRGNYTPKAIRFGEETDPYYFGLNKNNFNLYITKKNPDTDPATGIVNVGIGFQSLDNLTSGNYNTVVGSYSGSKITTGSSNSIFGNQAGAVTTTGSENVFTGTKTGFKNTDGTYNTFIGSNAGVELTRGSDNTFIGSGAGINHGKGTSGLWANNTFIGAGAATTTHAMGTYGDGNVVIGCHAPLGGLSSYKLVIDCYQNYVRHDQVNPLIGGDFINRTLSFDSNLQIRRTLPADSTFTRVAVMNGNNLIGYRNLSDFTGFIPITGTESDKPVSGHLEFKNPDGETLLYREDYTLKRRNSTVFYPASVTLSSINTDTNKEVKIEVGVDGGIITQADKVNSVIKDNQIEIYVGNSQSDLTNGKLVISETEVYLGKNAGATGKFISFSDTSNNIDIAADIAGAGLVGASYYGNNYTDNSFVQKQWVQEKIAESKPYKVYTATMSFGGSPITPNLVIFDNTIGNIIWARNGVGEYFGTLNGAFPMGKVWNIAKVNQVDGGVSKTCIAGRLDNDRIFIKLLDDVGSAVDLIGEVGSIEFRIYN